MIIATDGPWGRSKPGAAMFARQIDHAHLSGLVAAAWCKPAAFSDAAWERFVRAVGAHDDGWVDADAGPEVDARGMPRDFLHMPDAEHLDIWQRGSELWADRDTFAALMVTQHALWLAEKMPPLERAQDRPRYEQFVSRWTQQIDTWKASLADDPDTAPLMMHEMLTDCRRLMGWFDLLSLVLLGAMQGKTYTSPVPVGAAKQVVSWRCADAGTMLLSPWPLTCDTLTVACPAVTLAPSRFESTAAYRRALGEARPVELEWTLRPH